MRPYTEGREIGRSTEIWRGMDEWKADPYSIQWVRHGPLSPFVLLIFDTRLRVNLVIRHNMDRLELSHLLSNIIAECGVTRITSIGLRMSYEPTGLLVYQISDRIQDRWWPFMKWTEPKTPFALTIHLPLPPRQLAALQKEFNSQFTLKRMFPDLRMSTLSPEKRKIFLARKKENHFLRLVQNELEGPDEA